MTGSSKRTTALLALVAALGALVILDRTGVFAGAEGNALDEYQSVADVAEGDRSLLEQRSLWTKTLEESKNRWNQAEAKLIKTPSVDIAAGRLRAMAQRTMEELGVSLQTSVQTSTVAPIEDEQIRVVGLELTFRVDNPDTLYTIVDLFENLPDVYSHVSYLSVVGPGVQMRAGLDVTLRLESLAWIGGQAS